MTGATTTFMHSGFTAGPVAFTAAAGHLVEERRYEPFGAPIDARELGVDGPPDLEARDLTPLNKRTEVATGYSDHGARWMAPSTGRWMTPDPPVEGPSPDHLLAPWHLNPYQYAAQNPAMYWDPDGREPFKVEHDAAQRRANAEHAALREKTLAAATAAIGGAIPGRTKPPPADTPPSRVIAALDWNNKLGQYEAGALHPVTALLSLVSMYQAFRASDEFGRRFNPDGNDGDIVDNEIDAFRHVYGGLIFTRREGAERAKQFGDSHEVTLFNASSTAMDLWNNAVARQLAVDYPDQDPFQVVLDAMRSGLIVTRPYSARDTRPLAAPTPD